MDKVDVYCQSVTGRHVSLVQKDVGSNRLRYAWKLELGGRTTDSKTVDMATAKRAVATSGQLTI